jgi:hypothetical protein
VSVLDRWPQEILAREQLVMQGAEICVRILPPLLAAVVRPSHYSRRSLLRFPAIHTTTCHRIINIVLAAMLS